MPAPRRTARGRAAAHPGFAGYPPQPAYVPPTEKRRRGARPRNSDFVEFLHRALDMLFLPITYPLGLLRDLLTSPMTITVVVKAALLVLLIGASAVVSVAAVGAFWWSWGTGGNVELEGWLVYGSRDMRIPHALLPVAPDRFQEDLAYDVQVELELVRPQAGAEEMGNFMVTLDLRSARAPEMSIIRAAQPSLPPPPLPSSVFLFPTFPTWMLPPCIIPWPLRALCPGRLLGYSGNPSAKIKERRRKGTLVSPARGNQVVVLTKELVEGVVVAPGRGDAVGGVFVSIGREDTNSHDASRFYREVRTTGWVVIRFIPHPTGLRWLLTSNPIPGLVLLPPISLTLTLSSALIGFIVMSCIGRKRKKTDAKKEIKDKKEDKDKIGSPPREDSDDNKTALDRALFEREAVGDVLEQHGRAWAALERRRRSVELDTSPRRRGFPTPDASDTGDTPRATTAEPTPETATESGTAATTTTESVAATSETWDESESWDSSTEGREG